MLYLKARKTGPSEVDIRVIIAKLRPKAALCMWFLLSLMYLSLPPLCLCNLYLSFGTQQRHQSILECFSWTSTIGLGAPLQCPWFLVLICITAVNTMCPDCYLTHSFFHSAELCEDRDYFPLHSFYSQGLEKCLAHGRASVIIYLQRAASWTSIRLFVSFIHSFVYTPISQISIIQLVDIAQR